MERIGCLRKPNGRSHCHLNIKLLLIMIFAAALVLAGCAYDKAYKRGTKLSERQQYEQAIAELEHAVKLAEDGHKKSTAKRYREKLEEVKRQAGQFFYNRAEERFAQTDLGEAQSLIEKCVTYCPQEQPYWAFRQRVHKAIADAEQMRTTALSLAEQRQWKEANDRMSEALSLYKTMPGGQGDLKQIQDRAYRYYVGLAEEKLQQGDLEAAQAEAQTALIYREGGREANSVLKTAKDRIEARGLIARARVLLEQGDCEEALRVLEQAQRLHRSHAELPDLLGRARRAVCDKLIAQGRGAMEAGEYAAALRLFNRSNRLLQGYAGVNVLIADVQSRLAEVHLQAAGEQLKNGFAGCAVLHAVSALGYQPDSFDAGGKLAQYIERVQREVRYTIAFVGFEARPEHQTVADTFDSASLEYLTHLRRMNVALVEGPDMQTTFAQGDSQLTVEAAIEDGVDAFVSGQVLDVQVTSENRRTGYGESIYQDGYRPEPNPDYLLAAGEVDRAMEELEQARKRLARAEARLARYDRVDPRNPEEMARKRRAREDVAQARRHLVNAAADVAAARLRMAGTPQEVLVPNMVSYQYPIQTVTMTARVACMLKMQDADTGELILAERLEGKQVRSDRFVQADPARNVPEDPLEFPSDSTLLEAAENEAIGKLKQSLNAACKKHGRRFMAQMQRAEAAGDAAQVADSCIKTLFAYPIVCENTDKAVTSLTNCLGQENDLVDIQGLLRAHCHLLLEPAEFPVRLEEKDGQVIIRQFYERPSDDVRCPCVLTSVDRQSVHSISELQALIDHYASEEKASITVLSSGRYVTTELKLRPRKR